MLSDVAAQGGGWGPPVFPVGVAGAGLLFPASELAAIQTRLDQQPLPTSYRTVLEAMAGRIALGESQSLDDDAIVSQRFKARACKDLAFFHAVNRHFVGGQVSIPTSAERQILGDKVRDWLLNLYDRSRLAVPSPLGTAP